MKNNGVKIQNFLEELKRPYNASGRESKVYFISGKDNKQYVLKSYYDPRYKFSSQSEFFQKMDWLRGSTERLIKQGVNIPRVYDFGVLQEEGGGETFIEVEDKMPGDPIYILHKKTLLLKDDHTSYVENAEMSQDEFVERTGILNLERQELLLDAPVMAFDKLAKDFEKMYNHPTGIVFDAFAENCLFDKKKQQFSMIDLEVDSDEGNRFPLGTDRIISDTIFALSISQTMISFMTESMGIQDKLRNNNAEIQGRVIKSLDKAGLLVAFSEKSKVRLLDRLSTVVQDLQLLESKVKIRR